MSDVTDLKAEVLLLRRENKELRDEIKLNPLECALSEAQAFRGQVDALQVENAKLCDEIERLRSVVSDGADNAREVLAENAKLLRLLHALALCADDNADCDKCVMNGAVYSSVRQTFCDGMADELRAVGIEVDE